MFTLGLIFTVLGFVICALALFLGTSSGGRPEEYANPVIPAYLVKDMADAGSLGAFVVGMFFGALLIVAGVLCVVASR